MTCKAHKYLESRGWRLWSRRKHGMYIKERWYHPSNGMLVFNQTEALIEQRRKDRLSKQKATA